MGHKLAHGTQGPAVSHDLLFLVEIHFLGVADRCEVQDGHGRAGLVVVLDDGTVGDAELPMFLFRFTIA